VAGPAVCESPAVRSAEQLPLRCPRLERLERPVTCEHVDRCDHCRWGPLRAQSMIWSSACVVPAFRLARGPYRDGSSECAATPRRRVLRAAAFQRIREPQRSVARVACGRALRRDVVVPRMLLTPRKRLGEDVSRATASEVQSVRLDFVLLHSRQREKGSLRRALT